ncbi:hypothetical protein HDU89_002780 [Geranomyces variabilis]|nr:hypothetical protein HDU89_002780 [Geranomyces variabilis]
MTVKLALQNPSFAAIPHPEVGRFLTFESFYPFYLGQHANRVCRRLHVVGTTGVVMTFFYAIAKDLTKLAYIPLIGYGFAWVGHFFFEKNKPATFKYPVWSLRGDFKLWLEVLSGKRAF